MERALIKLKHQIFDGSGSEEILNTMDQCLYGILDNYNHSEMVIFTRLLEIMLETDLASEASKILKIVDLVKFPVKKYVE